MEPYKSDYYTHIVLILIFPLYYLLGMLIYYLKRRKPSLKARIPRLVLITALGLFLRDFIILLLSTIAFSPSDALNSRNTLLCGCVINNLVYSVL